MFEIKRSPAKVCWHVVFNGSVIDTASTKTKAIATKEVYEKAYGRLTR